VLCKSRDVVEDFLETRRRGPVYQLCLRSVIIEGKSRQWL
jgi:hypothetical protein